MNNFKVEDADALFSKYYSDWQNCILSSFKKYQNDCIQAIPNLDPTTIANVINAYIRNGFEDYAKNSTDFSFLELQKRGFFLSYRDDFAIRLKKVDSSLRPGNISTKRIEEIRRQECVLPGFENRMIFLVIGYQLDPLLSTVTGINLIMEGVKHNTWAIKIDNFSELVQTRFDIDPCEENIIPKRVRLKDSIRPAKEA